MSHTKRDSATTETQTSVLICCLISGGEAAEAMRSEHRICSGCNTRLTRYRYFRPWTAPSLAFIRCQIFFFSNIFSRFILRDSRGTLIKWTGPRLSLEQVLLFSIIFLEHFLLIYFIYIIGMKTWVDLLSRNSCSLRSSKSPKFPSPGGAK